MAQPITIQVKETAKVLKQVLKKQPHHLQKLIQMLLLIQEGKHSSKYDLAIALSVNRNSIQTWRNNYNKVGDLSPLNRTVQK